MIEFKVFVSGITLNGTQVGSHSSRRTVFEFTNLVTANVVQNIGRNLVTLSIQDHIILVCTNCKHLVFQVYLLVVLKFQAAFVSSDILLYGC